MALYLMLGNYTNPSVHDIKVARTKEAVGIIEKNNGQVVSMYAMLGQFDVVLIVNLPGNREAMEVSVGLSKVTGIHFNTGPVIPIDRFDEMMEMARKAEQALPVNDPNYIDDERVH